MPTNKELDKVIDKILEGLSPEAMARWIGIDFQKARESYVISNRDPKTLKEFVDELKRYCAHQLAEWLRAPKEDPFIMDCALHDAFRYAENAFPGARSIDEVYSIVKKGIKGAWKKVLDALAEGVLSSLTETNAVTVIFGTMDKAGLNRREGHIELLRRYRERFPEFLPDFYKDLRPDLLYEVADFCEIFKSHAKIGAGIDQVVKRQREGQDPST
jgi:hypothetical protein